MATMKARFGTKRVTVFLYVDGEVRGLSNVAIDASLSVTQNLNCAASLALQNAVADGMDKARLFGNWTALMVSATEAVYSNSPATVALSFAEGDVVPNLVQDRAR